MHPRSNPRSRRCRPACIAGGTAPFPCRGGAGPRAGDSEPADITGASVFRPRRALDMHARSPAEISFVRAFGYYLRGSDASVRLLANTTFLRGDRRCDQSGKRRTGRFSVVPWRRTARSVRNRHRCRSAQAVRCFRTSCASHPVRAGRSARRTAVPSRRLERPNTTESVRCGTGQARDGTNDFR